MLSVHIYAVRLRIPAVHTFVLYSEATNLLPVNEFGIRDAVVKTETWGVDGVGRREWWGAGVVICLERGADLHMAQLMPLPLAVSCFSKIQIGSTFLVPAHPVVTDKAPLNGCVYKLGGRRCPRGECPGDECPTLAGSAMPRQHSHHSEEVHVL